MKSKNLFKSKPQNFRKDFSKFSWIARFRSEEKDYTLLLLIIFSVFVTFYNNTPITKENFMFIFVGSIGTLNIFFFLYFFIEIGFTHIDMLKKKITKEGIVGLVLSASSAYIILKPILIK
tara:strand:+ start:1108 stop:1467 length:360 start_codon:yes stop_codon:yes gene_type:complete